MDEQKLELEMSEAELSYKYKIEEEREKIVENKNGIFLLTFNFVVSNYMNSIYMRIHDDFDKKLKSLVGASIGFINEDKIDSAIYRLKYNTYRGIVNKSDHVKFMKFAESFYNVNNDPNYKVIDSFDDLINEIAKELSKCLTFTDTVYVKINKRYSQILDKINKSYNLLTNKNLNFKQIEYISLKVGKMSEKCKEKESHTSRSCEDCIINTLHNNLYENYNNNMIKLT